MKNLLKAKERSEYLQAIAILTILYNSLPELQDEETPLSGSDAVDVLVSVWPKLTKLMKSLKTI